MFNVPIEPRHARRSSQKASLNPPTPKMTEAERKKWYGLPPRPVPEKNWRPREILF